MTPLLRPILVALLALLGVACSGTSSNLAPLDPPAPLVPFEPAVQINQRWSAQIGNGTDGHYLRLPPLVADGRVFVASRDGQVKAFEATSGTLAWQVELDDTTVLGGPGDGGELLLLGGDAQVIALDKSDGTERWRAPVSSEVLSRPVRIEDVVVVHAVDGQVTALKADSGERLWRYRQEVPLLSLRGTSAPAVVGKDGVVVGFANAQVAALTLKDGHVAWQTAVAVPRGRSELERMVDVDAEPFIADGAAYTVSYQGRLSAVSLDGGRMLWSRDFSSYTGLAAAGRELFTTDAHGDVWAFARTNGGSLWKQAALHGRRVTAPTVQGPMLVVGDYEGYIHWLAREDGRPIARARLEAGDASAVSEEEPDDPDEEDYGILAAPTVAGEWVYVVNAEGQLSAYQVAPK